MPALLTAIDLEKSFRTDGVERPVLRGLSLDAQRGEWVAVMGPSGCGKSTMLHLLGGLDLPDRGSVVLDGDDLTRMGTTQRALLRRRKVGYVFQQYNLVPHLDVSANIELTPRLAGRSRREARERARDLLDWLGLAEHAHALPGSLSGGEQQRVAIARAVANRPEVLLADEPTGALDSEGASLVLDLLRAQHERGQTIVMVTHDPAVADAADRLVRVVDGRILGEGPVEPIRTS